MVIVLMLAMLKFIIMDHGVQFVISNLVIMKLMRYVVSLDIQVELIMYSVVATLVVLDFHIFGLATLAAIVWTIG